MVSSLDLQEVARRYGKAVLELAIEQDALNQTIDEVQGFQEFLGQSAELKEIVASPVYSREEQQKALKSVGKHLKLSELILGLNQNLCAAGRIFLLDDVLTCFIRQAEESLNIKLVHIETAKELTEDQKQRLTQALEKELKTKVRLDLKVIPTLKGGISIGVGSIIADNTIKSKLNRYHQAMKGMSS